MWVCSASNPYSVSIWNVLCSKSTCKRCKALPLRHYFLVYLFTCCLSRPVMSRLLRAFTSGTNRYTDYLFDVFWTMNSGGKSLNCGHLESLIRLHACVRTVNPEQTHTGTRCRLETERPWLTYAGIKPTTSSLWGRRAHQQHTSQILKTDLQHYPSQYLVLEVYTSQWWLDLSRPPLCSCPDPWNENVFVRVSWFPYK